MRGQIRRWYVPKIQTLLLGQFRGISPRIDSSSSSGGGPRLPLHRAARLSRLPVWSRGQGFGRQVVLAVIPDLLEFVITEGLHELRCFWVVVLGVLECWKLQNERIDACL